VDEVVTALEAVELLQDDDGERDVVLLEVVDAGVIEENDVGVDHEELLHLPSRPSHGGAKTSTPQPAGRSRSVHGIRGDPAGAS